MNNSLLKDTLLSSLIPLGICSITFFAFYEPIVSDCLRNLDRELMQLSVLQAYDFSAYSGAYSRFEFRHPGPFIFYYLALFQNFFPEIDAHAVSRLSMIFYNFLLLSLCTLILRRFFSLPLLSLTLAPIYLLSIQGLNTSPLIDYWNPNFVPLAFLTTLLSAGLVSCKGLMWLPLLIFSGSIAVQSHLGTTISVSIVTLVAVGLAWGHKDKYLGVSLFVSFLTASILWCLPAVEVLYSPESNNLRDLIQYALAEKSNNSMYDTWGFLLSFYKYRDILSAFPSWLWALMFTLLPLRLIWTNSLELRRLTVLYYLALLSAFISAFFISGDLRSYLLSQLFAITTLAPILSIAAFQVKPKGHAVSFLTIILGFLFSLSYLPNKPESKACKREGNIRQFMRALKPDSNTLYRVTLDSPAPYSFTARFLLEMRKANYYVCVSPDWTYRYGRGLGCDQQLAFFSNVSFANEKHLILSKYNEPKNGFSKFSDGKVTLSWDETTITHPLSPEILYNKRSP